jgi:hypothetical protein
LSYEALELTIEVGWASVDPATNAIVSEGILVRPPQAWRGNPGAWDPVEELLQHGQEPDIVARRVNEALGGPTLFSDSPDADGRWIRQVFAIVGVKMEFEIAKKRSDTLIVELADQLGLALPIPGQRGRTPGSVRAKAKWRSYSITIGGGAGEHRGWVPKAPADGDRRCSRRLACRGRRVDGEPAPTSLRLLRPHAVSQTGPPPLSAPLRKRLGRMPVGSLPEATTS